MEKKYTRKEYLKIGIIIIIIVVPLVVAYGAAGYFDSGGSNFWSEWDCDQMNEFAKTPEFDLLTDEVKIKYDSDFVLCLDFL